MPRDLFAGEFTDREKRLSRRLWIRRVRKSGGVMQRDLFGNTELEYWSWENPNPHSKRRHLVRFIPHAECQGTTQRLMVKTACGRSMREQLYGGRVVKATRGMIDCGSCRSAVFPGGIDFPKGLRIDLANCVLLAEPYNQSGLSEFFPVDDDPASLGVPADWLEELGDPAACLLRIIGRLVSRGTLVELFEHELQNMAGSRSEYDT